MTDLRKAAEMALDWFEGCQVNGIDDTHEAAVAAAEALRQALAQPDEVLAEREACAKLVEDWDTAMTDKLAAAIRARGEK